MKSIALHYTCRPGICIAEGMNKVIYTLLVLVCFSCKKDKPFVNKGGASDFLSAEHYDRLIVDLVFVNGMKPSEAAINRLSDFMETYLHKPKGISIVEREISVTGKTTVTLKELQEMETKHRTRFHEGRTAAMWLFFVDAEYSENSPAGNGGSVLGIAYGASSMVIFEKTIREHSGGLAEPPVHIVESAVIHHEFGHIFGLVDNGIKPVSQHQDVSHGKHCENRDCLMYYATETTDFLSNLLGGAVPVFDAACEADLRSAGAK
jgi:hypothetical protein